jgi:hypothetical protein
LETSKTTSDQNLDAQVREAVKDIVAIRKLGSAAHMSTNKSQSAVLRELNPEALKRVARILAEMDEAAQ